MLVTFSSPAHGDVTFFGDVAVKLLHLMGHSGTVPGALSSDSVAPALARLESAIATEPPPPEPQAEPEDDDEEPGVSLRHRALPLIGLLKAAAREGSTVMWDR